MRTNLWRMASLFTLLAMLISPIGATGAASAAPEGSQSPAARSSMRVIDATYVGVSQPLSSLAPIKVDANTPSALRKMEDRLVLPKAQNSLSKGGLDASIVQKDQPGLAIPTTEANFEGVNNVSGVLPPDTQGDVGYDPSTGTKYYIQWVNLAFEIWDVTSAAAPVSLYGPAAGNTLWAGTGTICEANNDGDPITQFDHLANRWMMSQFALGFPNNFHQCIAVSATADPTGAWYLYDFQTSTTVFNDYPHFGVWPDGYYMTVNQFNGSTDAWAGAGVAVFERAQMLQGLPARMIYIDTGQVTTNYGGMLPSDLDGPAPAAGTPNYFMEWDDSSWLGDTSDTLRIWEFKTDWANPANTTFGLNSSYDPNLMIPTANVDPDMCNFDRSCIPQPDTTQGLDAISDRLMYRLQYRDFGSYQTIVGNRTVDATGTDQAGVYWFELRDTGSGFAINQEGVYTSGSDNAWMGSAAMDSSGDIALGFSVSSSTTYPSVHYTGRLALDPAGTMPQGEGTIIAGSGSQTHSAARWGDYSMMAVDAQDGCTFWYTNEYVQTTGSASWQTRIGSFKFPSCTSLPTGILSGTVTDGTNPIEGAVIDVTGGYSTVTDASGHYALTLVDGTYDVTASKYGYISNTASSVVVTSPDTTTQDFTLAAAPVSTISGVVTDALTGWPLYARIDIFGYPLGPVFTNPTTGAYSVDLVDGPYTFTVSALSGGYQNTIAPITMAGNATHNFTLSVDTVTCSAPGYEISGFNEHFEAWPLTGWTTVDNISGGGLTWWDNLTYLEDNYTGGTGLAATVSSDQVSGNYDTELRTPEFAPASLPNLTLSYRANYQDYTSYDALDLDISNDGGTTWTNISNWTTDHGTLHGLGENEVIDLTPYVTTNFILRWHYYTSETDPWDYYAEIDDVQIGATCEPIPNGGLVVGAVNDSNTSTAIGNAVVEDAAMNQAIFINNSADISQPSPMYIIGEPAGSINLTASAPMYANDTQSPTVVNGSTVRQDFNLAAGLLSVSPTSLVFNASIAANTSSKPATIVNAGGTSAGYEVFAIPGTFAGYTPTGPFAPHTRHSGPPAINALTSASLRMHFFPSNIPPLAAGNVTSSWSTGLTHPWGIGFNTDANDLWVGDLAAAGGDGFDHRFTTAGVDTGDTIDTSSWVASYNADMTYNPFTNTLWQVNVGGDNCIYELDPASMVSTGNTICAPFGTSERALAFDPVTNTYYSGSWTDGILNHFAPDGTLLDSVSVGLDFSGMAYNPSTKHLFVLSNTDSTTTPTHYDITVLDASTTAYSIIGGFNLKSGGVEVFDDYDQAGLEIDCAGNLWAVNQTTKEVYVAESGETGVCNWQASWLSTTPAQGTVSANSNANLAVNVNATGLTAGTHNAYLRVVNGTPYGDEILPVTLNVTASPIFADVPLNYWANSWIERLYLNGITGGCGTSPLVYCPSTVVTRDQMAVFLLRGIHGSSYAPPAVGASTGFNDVPTTYWAAAWIKELAAEGITGGCGNGNFCPTLAVTRDQMAVFLLRGEHGSSYAPPPASGTMFGDVSGTFWAAAWIEQLANESITSGCGNGNYCPATPVSRDQMAVFLVRAFNLP